MTIENNRQTPLSELPMESLELTSNDIFLANIEIARSGGSRAEAEQVEEYLKFHFKHFIQLPYSFRVIAVKIYTDKFIRMKEKNPKVEDRKHLNNATRFFVHIHPILEKHNTNTMRILEQYAVLTCWRNKWLADTFKDLFEMTYKGVRAKSCSISNALWKAKLITKFSAKEFIPNEITANKDMPTPYLYRIKILYNEEDWNDLLEDVKDCYYNYGKEKSTETPEKKQEKKEKQKTLDKVMKTVNPILAKLHTPEKIASKNEWERTDLVNENIDLLNRLIKGNKLSLPEINNLLQEQKQLLDKVSKEYKDFRIKDNLQVTKNREERKKGINT